MKHDWKVTILLIMFFVLAQLIGLMLINIDMEPKVDEQGTYQSVKHQDTSLGSRPEMTGLGAFIYIAIGILLGTVFVLLIIRTKKINLWKAWFFVAVFLAISLALGVVFSSIIALVIGFILAVLKIWKPNIIIHNITELLMYAGIAVFLVPLLNILWAAVLLIAISIYDFIAVFKSKHMVKMAKFQTKSNVFAGLLIPYTPKEKSLGSIPKSPKNLKILKTKKIQRKNAILGGGDIAFPLLFIGVIMESITDKLMNLDSFINQFINLDLAFKAAKSIALSHSLIIILTTTIALALLFILAEKNKFYPAMPIISAGCFIGYAIVLLL